jgi:hypothetical protein
MSRRTRRLVVYPALFVTYLAVMIFSGCVNKLLLYPSTGPLPAHTAERRVLDLGNGRVVECWVDRSPGARRTGRPLAYSIDFTGNATRAEQVASYAAYRWGDRPVEVWMVNYPGFGGSTGPAQLETIPPVTLAVYDHVAKLAAESGGRRPIFAGGNSLGTAAALCLAGQRPTAGLVLQNPPALRSLLLRQHGWYNLWLVAGPLAVAVPSDLDSPTNAAKVDAPAVYLLAENDQSVVPSNQKLVVDAHKGPKRVIAFAGGHNDPIPTATDPEVQKGLDWLWGTAGLGGTADAGK